MNDVDPRSKLEPFEALIGEWTMELTHPAVEGTVIRGWTTYEWLDGGQFLLQRAVNEHPDFPDSLSVIGVMEGDTDLSMQYFDSRGVHRVYAVGFDGRELTLERDEPGFAQRLTATAQRRRLDARRRLATERGRAGLQGRPRIRLPARFGRRLAAPLTAAKSVEPSAVALRRPTREVGAERPASLRLQAALLARGGGLRRLLVELARGGRGAAPVRERPHVDSPAVAARSHLDALADRDLARRLGAFRRSPSRGRPRPHRWRQSGS